MQNEYKKAMEKISLSDSDKARILENVKKAYAERPQETVEPMPAKKRPFSLRQAGMVAAAAIVVIIGVGIVRKQMNVTVPTNPNKKIEGTQVAENQKEEIVWETLDSVKDIEKETECETYSLSSISNKYKVKEVKVVKEKKMVNITYEHSKKKDVIEFEYTEKTNAVLLENRFEEKEELKTEQIGDTSVKMFGADKCEAMLWEKEDCIFAVTMTEGRTEENAKKMVTGTKKGIRKVDEDEKKPNEEEKDDILHKNAVGWESREEESTSKERADILGKAYDSLGFRVLILKPATQIAYKIVDGYESFSFYYNDDEELQDKRIYGYAGKKEGPDKVLSGFSFSRDVTVNNMEVSVFENKKGEKAFLYVNKGVYFTLLIEDWTEAEVEDVLAELFSVIRVSFDDGRLDENDAKEEPKKDNDGKKDNDKKEDTENEEEENPSDDATLEANRNLIREIQDAVVEQNMDSFASYCVFPLYIGGLDVTVNSAGELKALGTSAIFTSDWIDSIAAFDTDSIQADTKSFVMGEGRNFMNCEVKNNSVIITELYITVPKKEETPASEQNIMP